MIRKLRIRLILITMLAVLLVLIILIGGINIFNYRQVISESDDILQLLMRNGGAFAEDVIGKRDGFEPGGPEFDPNRDDFEQKGFDGEPSDFPPPSGRSRPGFFRFDEGRIDSKELAYETRYFSVLLTEAGQIIRTDTNAISAISESTANEYAVRVLRKGSSSGFIGDYRYLVGEKDAAGCHLVIFRDCGAALANFRNFRNISIAVSLACLLLVGVLVFFASGRIVRPVAESYEKQKRFITDAGHEIKTPLAIITADAEVLEMEIGAPSDDLSDVKEGTAENEAASGNEWLSDIKLQVSRLSALTQDLITLSKMEETGTTLNMTDLDLSDHTRSQTNSFTAVATAGNKTISSRIEDDIHIQADKKAIDSLLSIVLDNAVKYAPENGNIDVRLTRTRKGALLEVINDTKEPISEEECRNMFERFYRTDSSRNSETGGHGIGLSLARAIVEKHRGRITATSAGEKKLAITIHL